MSKAANIRVVRLFWFDGAIPKFETTAELKEWHEAVGRMVTYGMHHDHDDDTVQYVNISFSFLYHVDCPAREIQGWRGQVHRIAPRQGRSVP